MGSVFCAQSSEKNAKSAEYKWGYEKHNGCHTWKSHFSAACGNRQSPLDIITNTGSGAVNFPSKNLKIECRYPKSLATTANNNGHTVQWNIKESDQLSCELVIDNEVYKMLQFHYHVPTEHTFNGQQKHLEIHFVHAHVKTGELAVIGFLFDEVSDSESENKILETLKKCLALKSGEKDRNLNVNLNDLDFSGTWCHYDGSLTTPPCSEGVRWFVHLNRFQIKKSTLALFSDSVHGDHNARKVQPKNDRVLYQVKATHKAK